MLGHSCGDRVLRAVSERLKAEVSGGGIVARLSGDEFAVAIPGAAMTEAVAQFSERMALMFGMPLMVGTRQHRLKASIGFEKSSSVYSVTSGQRSRTRRARKPGPDPSSSTRAPRGSAAIRSAIASLICDRHGRIRSAASVQEVASDAFSQSLPYGTSCSCSESIRVLREAKLDR